MKNHKLQIMLILLILGIKISFSETWIQQTSGTISNLNCVYFLNNTTGFIGGDGVILKTTNGGINWININNQNTFSTFSIQFVNNSTGFAGTNNKILKTSNSGLFWDTTIFGGGRNLFFLNSNIGYSNKNNDPFSVWKSTNSGTSWDSISQINTTNTVNNIYFVDVNTGFASGTYFVNMFAGLYYADIWKTTNSGINWVVSFTSTMSTYFITVKKVIFINSQTGYAVGSMGSPPSSYLFKTSNSGVNWNTIPISNQMLSLKFIGNETGWFCGWDGKILYTLNGGSTILQQVSNTNAKLNDVYMIDNLTGFITGDNGVILKTTNGGITGLNPLSNYIPNNYSLSQNFPNPFNPSTQISFDIPKSSFVNLVVYDALGREIEQLVNEELNPGSYKYDWSAEGGAISYPSGIYFYKLQAGEFVQTKKMVLIK